MSPQRDPMRLLLAAATWVALVAGHSTLAQNASVRLDDPKVKGQPVDHCADIDGKTDCSAGGEAKAAMKACVENGFNDQAGSHWRTSSGTAMHYITEYDMHAGEVGGRWVEQPTNGTFDWITCKK
jgi:hypothetical protein